jgi:hypothetical protein
MVEKHRSIIKMNPDLTIPRAAQKLTPCMRNLRSLAESALNLQKQKNNEVKQAKERAAVS